MVCLRRTTRSELTNAIDALDLDSDYRYAYDFDEIGNRESSSERGTNTFYAANQLNQYTSISNSALSAFPSETFTPQFDEDGNQTLVKTATELWTVSFDAENRPVSWANGVTNIVMTYDRLCRRISKSDVRFVYKVFLQVCDNLSNVTIWDPTKPAATRPLISDRGANASYYVHDGGKNVCGVVSPDGNVLAHYSYSPFGSLDSANSNVDDMVCNSFCFSSEFSDDELGTVYYNFRTLNPSDGRWIGRDPGDEQFSCNLYWYLNNRPIGHSDWLGLDDCREANSDFTLNKIFNGLGGAIGSFSISYHRTIMERICNNVKCDDCRSGYTVERNVMDGGGAGVSWNIPIAGLPAVMKVPVSISYAFSGGEHYTYNSCTDVETSEECHSFSISGGGGASVGVGPFITFSAQLTVSYSWTDCGRESSKLDIGGTLEQCYFGQCWSANLPGWDTKW